MFLQRFFYSFRQARHVRSRYIPLFVIILLLRRDIVVELVYSVFYQSKSTKSFGYPFPLRSSLTLFKLKGLSLGFVNATALSINAIAAFLLCPIGFFLRKFKYQIVSKEVISPLSCPKNSIFRLFPFQW